MKSFKLFCFGFGQVAKYFVENLIKENCKFDLITTNTTSTQEKKIKNFIYKSYFFKDDKFDTSLLEDLNLSNKILISISPQNETDIVSNLFEKNFRINNFDWVTYLSATSVYGDKKGQWVDEKSIPEPTSKNGIARLNAESKWLKYFYDFNLPIQIFRLSGIYSLENNIVKRLKIGTLRIVEKKNHFFSRIHVEDIAKVLTISLKKFSPGQIYNISDNYPCSNEEVTKYAANLMQMNLPKKIKPEDLESEMLKNFYKDSKKVSNKRMKNFFGYQLKYPSFKEGLNMIRDHQV